MHVCYELKSEGVCFSITPESLTLVVLNLFKTNKCIFPFLLFLISTVVTNTVKSILVGNKGIDMFNLHSQYRGCLGKANT